MAELIYYNKNAKEIDANEWGRLIRDSSYTNDKRYAKNDLELNLSWVGVSWYKEKNPKTWCLSLETVDELGMLQSVCNFLHSHPNATKEFNRVKGMIDDGTIFQVNNKKEIKKKKSNEKK